MIELNLLPKELRRKKKRQMPTVNPVPIAAGVVALLITSHVILALLARNNGGLLQSLKVKWDQLAPQRETTQKLANEMNELERKITAVRALAKPALNWGKLMSGLNSAMIPNVWLSDLKPVFGGRSYSLAGGMNRPTSLSLSGHSLGSSEEATPNVAKFINSLESTKDFSGYFNEIELKEIKSSRVAGNETMMFDLICVFKKVDEPDEKKKE